MATTTHHIPPASIATGFFSTVLQKLSLARAAVGRSVGTFVKATQAARLIQAYNSMSDDQLAQLGLTRSEIAAHAAKVMDCEYDGL